MYEAFYGFKEKPFSMLPDPGFLFLSKKHQAALTLLEYGLLNHVGFCVISGEPGAGKTTILRALLERVPDEYTVGLITNTHQSFGGLLDWVLSAFDLHRPNLTHVEMHQIFMAYLIEEYANNRTVLLIVDEAQNMSLDALEELRMLSNVNSEKDQLMQVVLAGQPGLKETLRKPELMQFAQRIAVDYHLDSLNLEETCGYIQHRLLKAGAQKDVFTPAACERIHCYSGGTPRLINLLCETVLVYGFADQQELIDIDLVDEMVHERMKDSVVPIVNRDAINRDNSEACKELEKDFPWIQSEGGTKGLKPSVSTNTDVVGTTNIDSDGDQQIIIDLDSDQQIIEDYVELDATSFERTGVENKAEDVAVADDKPAHVFDDRGRGRAPERKVEPDKVESETDVQIPSQKKNEKPAVSSKTFLEAEKNIFSSTGKLEDNNETPKQLIKYGVLAGVFALILIVIALLLNDGSGAKPKVVNNESLELQKQREQDAERVKQLQVEAELLKKERDAAIVMAEEGKRAKEEAERLAAEKAEKLAVEKTALAVKTAEEKRKLAEKKQIAQAKARERKAKQAEAAAKAEAEQAKLEAAKLEEQRRVMQIRLEEERRLKELEEARRLELERLEQQRLELQIAEKSAAQAAAEAAAKVVAEEAKAKSVECSGPAARFKSGCR